ncbi:MAG: DUF3943 domain-containing protein, partial [Treponemataceae bacterium]|nr:DUF3943 domain-containing protein [Treponemataceae bacterium]
MKKICALLFLPLCLHCGAFAEENDAPDSGADLIVSPSFSNYLLAGAGVIASNATLFLFNHFIMRAEYADISAETIRANFQSAWVWDQDTFRVNQLGHPYQGSFYFAAARSNGIPFEAALLYNVLG